MNDIKENKMGTMPITKLIFNMSLPIMFSMFVMALYNIVDSIFVSKINENALTAMSLAFPVQNLMVSVAVGTSIGVNALLSMRLGQKNQQEVNKAATNGIFLAVCNFVLFFLLGLLFIKSYLKSQTSDAQIINYGIEYLNIVVLGSFGMFVVITLDRLLQGTGRTLFSMCTQIIGAITNIILDPLLIFGIGPFPEMGIAGAALATVIGQWFSMIASFILNKKINTDVNLNFKSFKPDLEIISQIYKVGMPSILLQSITSVTVYFVNLILNMFSTTAIAVYGIFFKLNSFIFMPIFGLNNGVVPILAYNYGAKNKERIITTIRNATIFAVIVMLVGTLIFEIFPSTLLKMFEASDYMLEIGTVALRTIGLSFIGAAISISLSSAFQAFSVATYSMIISFIRQLIVLLPAAYLLSLTNNINNVWWAFPIAEIVAVALSFIFLIKVYRQKIKHL